MWEQITLFYQESCVMIPTKHPSFPYAKWKTTNSIVFLLFKSQFVLSPRIKHGTNQTCYLHITHYHLRPLNCGCTTNNNNNNNLSGHLGEWSGYTIPSCLIKSHYLPPNTQNILTLPLKSTHMTRKFTSSISY